MECGVLKINVCNYNKNPLIKPPFLPVRYMRCHDVDVKSHRQQASIE